MRILLVTFSLRNPNRDYEPFFVALRGNSHNWWHFIEQTCLVTTIKTANEFAVQLFPHMEITDSLLVAEIDPSKCQGWLPKAAWDWILQMMNQSKGAGLPRVLPPIPGLHK